MLLTSTQEQLLSESQASALYGGGVVAPGITQPLSNSQSQGSRMDE